MVRRLGHAFWTQALWCYWHVEPILRRIYADTWWLAYGFMLTTTAFTAYIGYEQDDPVGGAWRLGGFALLAIVVAVHRVNARHLPLPPGWRAGFVTTDGDERLVILAQALGVFTVLLGSMELTTMWLMSDPSDWRYPAELFSAALAYLAVAYCVVDCVSMKPPRKRKRRRLRLRARVRAAQRALRWRWSPTPHPSPA